MKKLLQFFQSRSLREMLQELAWLSKYSLHYKKEVLWYILIGVLGSVVSLIGSILSKHIIDAVTGFNTHGIMVALMFFVLMQLSQIITSAISSRIFCAF